MLRVLLALALMGGAAAGCGGGRRPSPPPPLGCRADVDCANGAFCDGLERCVGGECQPGVVPDCDDGLDCTRDSCDEAARQCAHFADDALCSDGDSCNGEESCEPALGRCLAGFAVSCADALDCTDDGCDSSTGACVYTIRDRDHDGHGDRACRVCDGSGACTRGDDCNEANAAVHPGATEICDDGLDNDCDSARDWIDPSCVPPNDGCSTALDISGGGTFVSSTRRTGADIATACGDSAAAPDVAFRFTLADAADVTLRVDGAASEEFTVALQSTCGDATADLRCGRGTAFDVRGRGLGAGTYWVIVSSTTSTGADFSLELVVAPPVPLPAGDLCDSLRAVDVSAGGVFSGSTAAAERDYATTCGSPGGRDVAFTFTLATPQEVDLTVDGAVATLTAAIQESCGVTGLERACALGQPAHTRVRELAAGTYWIVVASDVEQDFALTIALSPPNPASLVPLLPATSAPVAGCGDDSQFNVDLSPLSFPFNGTSYPLVAVSTNGYVRFGTAAYPTATCYADSCTDVNATFAAATPQLSFFAMDLYCGGSLTYTVDTANNRAVLYYQNFYPFGGLATARSSVQIVLFCDTGDVQFSYAAGSALEPNGRTPSIGVGEPAIAGGILNPHDFTRQSPGTIVSFGPGAVYQSPDYAAAGSFAALGGRGVLFLRRGAGWDVLVDTLP